MQPCCLLLFCAVALSFSTQIVRAFFIRSITLTPTYVGVTHPHPTFTTHLGRQFATGAEEDEDENTTNQKTGTSQNPSVTLTAFEDALFLERFKRRRDEAASKIEVELSQRPPSNSTHFADPKNVVISILDGLLLPHDPVPYFGYEILYTSSTSHWKDVLRKSVGAPVGTEEGLIFRALSASMERANNQFGILVGLGTDTGANPSSNLAEQVSTEDGYYAIEFPFDTLDYYDGTAWLECRLRDKKSDALLVVLGWSMKRHESEGSWLIDGIDWQDFREKYRPGIGREEWERICG